MNHPTRLLLVALLPAACVAYYPTHAPVPPIPAENVPAPPPSRTTLIWQPGHYDWDGRDYIWRRGEWVERAGHGVLWQDGFWQAAPHGSVWVPAHWM